MAEPALAPVASKLKPGQSYVAGLIAARRRINAQTGTLWLTVVRLPAADEFSHPKTIELRSHSPIGDVNDKWAGIVEINGFPRSYATKPDPETGEIKNVKTATISLDVVEQ